MSNANYTRHVRLGGLMQNLKMEVRIVPVPFSLVLKNISVSGALRYEIRILHFVVGTYRFPSMIKLINNFDNF